MCHSQGKISPVLSDFRCGCRWFGFFGQARRVSGEVARRDCHPSRGDAWVVSHGQGPSKLEHAELFQTETDRWWCTWPPALPGWQCWQCYKGRWFLRKRLDGETYKKSMTGLFGTFTHGESSLQTEWRFFFGTCGLHNRSCAPHQEHRSFVEARPIKLCGLHDSLNLSDWSQSTCALSVGHLYNRLATVNIRQSSCPPATPQNRIMHAGYCRWEILLKLVCICQISGA